MISVIIQTHPSCEFIFMLIRSTNRLAQSFGKMMSIRQALNMALDEEMTRDPNVFIIGEEVANYHGAYKITKGLIDRWGPTRLFDTPITEAGFTGLGVGAALMGLTPVVEFMTMNFSLQGIDHIFNSAGKLRYMSGGELSSGIVFRGLNGPAAAVAAQHSQCLASLYSNVPGIVTVSPYDCEDCRGLLKTAIRSKEVVVFLENENLYSESYEVSDEVMDPDFTIPFGKAKTMREGKHVSLVAYSRSVEYCLIAAEALAKQGIECEVINLRSIKPLDRDAIVNTVMKTSRIVTVEDGFPQSGIGAQIAAVVHETDAFHYLDAPVQRVTAVDVPMPYSESLELAVVPYPDTIIKAVHKVMRGVIL